MELLTPDYGLLFWSMLCFLLLCLVPVALYRINKNNHLTLQQKLVWSLVVLFIPVFGALFYFSNWPKHKKQPN